MHCIQREFFVQVAIGYLSLNRNFILLNRSKYRSGHVRHLVRSGCCGPGASASGCHWGANQIIDLKSGPKTSMSSGGDLLKIDLTTLVIELQRIDAVLKL